MTSADAPRPDVTGAIARLGARLGERADPAKRAWWERYLRGAIGFRGVPMGVIRGTLHDWFREEGIGEWPPDVQRNAALALIGEPLAEDKLAGILFLQEILLPRGLLDCEDELPRFAELFDGGAIADWSTCDWFCVRVLGPLAERAGERCARRIGDWRNGQGLWRRRAAAVAFVDLARRGDENFPGFTDLVLSVCATLAADPARFLQTAVGWVLRDLSVAEPARVAEFLAAHRAQLSREALRMATSRLPDAARDELLGARLRRRRR